MSPRIVFVAVTAVLCLLSVTDAFAQSVAPDVMLSVSPPEDQDYFDPVSQYALIGYLGYRVLALAERGMTFFETLRADLCSGTNSLTMTTTLAKQTPDQGE